MGNLLHPVDMADIAAVDDEHVAAAVEEWLATRVDDPTAATGGVRTGV